MKQIAVAAISGGLFGLGLAVAHMIDPAKVIGFLDVTGNWDPSLALVMGSALFVAAIGYKVAGGRPGPVFASAFRLPGTDTIDGSLIIGAAIFGVGWGIVGFCPGPAIASLGFGQPKVWLFVAAMVAGAGIHRFAGSRSRLSTAMPD